MAITFQDAKSTLALFKGSFPDENDAIRLNLSISHLDFAAFALVASLAERVCTAGKSVENAMAALNGKNVVDSLSVEAPKTKLLADKLGAMGLDSVLVITDNLDENLFLASRNLAHVLVVEPRHADPLSLVHYKKVLVTKGAVAQIEELLK